MMADAMMQSQPAATPAEGEVPAEETPEEEAPEEQMPI
jgi:hypothetical protein